MGNAFRVCDLVQINDPVDAHYLEYGTIKSVDDQFVTVELIKTKAIRYYLPEDLILADPPFDGETQPSIQPLPAEPKVAMGDRYNNGKIRWRNVPLFILEPVAEVGSVSEKHDGNPKGKYDTYNYLKGQMVMNCLDSAMRHLDDATNPLYPELDRESGLHPLAHAAWNCLVALYMIRTRPDCDDRFKTQYLKEKNNVQEK